MQFRAHARSDECLGRNSIQSENLILISILDLYLFYDSDELKKQTDDKFVSKKILYKPIIVGKCHKKEKKTTKKKHCYCLKIINQHQKKEKKIA